MSSKISKSLVKSKKSKSKRTGHSKNATKTKVVVRRLPPLILEQVFFESVEQWVNKETCTWSRFHQGRISKSKNKESIFSRAYLHFKTVEQVLEFHRGYDNHLFVDRQGNENRAVVEFAIYQKLPKEHKKPNPKQGTIETDPDYLAFLESLKVEETQHATTKEPGVLLESGATQLERLEARLANAAAINAANAVEKPKTTPLIEHLRALKSAKSKSQLTKQAQIAILSPPGSPAKGTGSKTVKQSQNSRAVHANEANQSFQYTAEASMSVPPTITIVPRPQTEEREKETRRAPVKITIQRRQKEQIRQFIQPSLIKKELDTIETNSKETIDKEVVINESRVKDQKDLQEEISKIDDKDAVSNTSSSTSNTAVTRTPIMNVPSSSYRRRDRSRKHGTDVKQPELLMASSKYISCPIINVIRQQEVVYPTCDYCGKKLKLPYEKRISKLLIEQSNDNKSNLGNDEKQGHQENKKSKLQVEDRYSLRCFRCHIIYKHTEISYRYRICIMVSINDYLYRDSLDRIFGCTAKEFEIFKTRSIFDMNAFEFNLNTFNALDYVINGELCLLEFSNHYYKLLKDLNDNNIDVIANNIQIMKPNSYLNVVGYFRNYYNNYEEKWNKFFYMINKLDERLIERLDGELEEVIVDNIYQNRIQEDDEIQEQISKIVFDTEIFIDSAEFEHLDIELLYCQGLHLEDSFNNLEDSDILEWDPILADSDYYLK
ncbi:12351_t:CDS:2 [Funneliformis caledonium]|uniref:12351_t:CDS:1 n=1 Tax=Funneliformis caledonium TaxID=1117310 RepID=A0A9N9FZ38_9GLOM|nr:12351_t:CDS:2 [Funneliformis caledonium]